MENGNNVDNTSEWFLSKKNSITILLKIKTVELNIS